MVEPRSQIGITSRVSMLLIRLAQGKTVRLSEKSSPAATRSVQQGDAQDPHDHEDLTAFAKQILQDCKQSTPHFQLLGVIVESLVLGEIVRAK